MNGRADISYDGLAGLYSKGDYPEILARTKSRPMQEIGKDPRRLGIVANASLKQGDKENAAEAFYHLANHIPPQRGFLLKSCAQLLVDVGNSTRLEEIAVAALSANPADTALARLIAGAVKDPATIEKLLPYLDPANPEHSFFKLNFYKSVKNIEKSYQAVSEGVKNSPQDIALNIEFYSQSRLMCDMSVLRDFESRMSNPKSDFDRNVFDYQLALDRLNWCDDEALQALPTQDSRKFDATRDFRMLNVFSRRQISPEGEKLRIGYLSDEFTNHVVLNVLKPVLIAHDREKFDIQLFCYTPEKDRKARADWPEQLRNEIISIRELGDEAAVERISAAGTDILVDLKGHTVGTRLNIMNLTDCPVTASYLGFPSTITGTSIDYLVSDPVVTPESSKAHYHEKLCRLPELQMPNAAYSDVSCVTSRAREGLPEDRFVFVSINALRKMTVRLFRIWVDILKAVPDSVFWILTPGPTARRNLVAAFADEGIAADRLIFIEKKVGFDEHIARLGLGDLALDTLPYNGHSTTADLMRAGLPLVTMRGHSYHSRVSLSILKSFELDELAGEDDDGYKRIAIELARNPARLADIRTRLCAARAGAPLFDPTRMARHLEKAYQMMAERARAGLPPEHIDVPLAPKD